MDIETLRNYCLQKKAVNESFPFDDVSLVFKVMDRMFALINLDHPDLVMLKCQPDYAIDLRDRYHGVEPAFHFNKRHWNQVTLVSDVPDSLLLHLIDHSYEEVLKKFTKKKRALYDELP